MRPTPTNPSTWFSISLSPPEPRRPPAPACAGRVASCANADRAGRNTRFHHISAPVTNSAGGMIPMNVHRAFVLMPANRPKCSFASHSSARSPRRGVRLAGSSGSRKSTTAMNGCGNTRYTPLSAHMNTNRNDQNPIALCRSKFTRFQPARHCTPRPRRQAAVPGHQITAPLMHSTTSTMAPTPLTFGPVNPLSKSSCRLTNQSSVRTPGGIVSPRSAPVYGSNRCFCLVRCRGSSRCRSGARRSGPSRLS